MKQMWVVRKIMSRFLFPIPLCLEVLSVGLLLLCFTRKQKTGRTVVALAGVLLYLFASYSVSTLLLMPLESKYPPLFTTPGAPVGTRLREVNFVVVLASGFADDPGRPVEMQLDDGSIARWHCSGSRELCWTYANLIANANLTVAHNVECQATSFKATLRALRVSRGGGQSP
jgi:uncharacterized SAM-binding protein YcdF (DUF218 family)